MLQFDPADLEELAFTLHKAVKQSGLTPGSNLGTPGNRIRREVNRQCTQSPDLARHDSVSAGVADTGGLWCK